MIVQILPGALYTLVYNALFHEFFGRLLILVAVKTITHKIAILATDQSQLVTCSCINLNTINSVNAS